MPNSLASGTLAHLMHAFAAPYLHYAGPTQSLFFDIPDNAPIETMYNTPGFRRAMEAMKSIWNYTHPTPTDLTGVGTLFAMGRCAFASMLSRPIAVLLFVAMLKLICILFDPLPSWWCSVNWPSGFSFLTYDQPHTWPDGVTNYTVARSPVYGKMGTARFPGSQVVYVKSSNSFVNCEEDSFACPYSSGGINFSPVCSVVPCHVAMYSCSACMLMSICFWSSFLLFNGCSSWPTVAWELWHRTLLPILFVVKR